MPYSKEYKRSAAYKARRRADRERKTVILPFVGVDGEGGTLVEGERQEYLLLRAGEDHVLETGKPLTVEECLSFLAGLPQGVTYVSYFFDYDVTMIVRGLSLAKLRQLLDRESRTRKDGNGNALEGMPRPVYVLNGQFRIDYLPHKEFRVQRYIGWELNNKGKPVRKYSPWVVINDVGSFFQQAFVKSLNDWFADTPSCAPAIAKIAEGKAERNTFGAMNEYERRYNLIEVIMLARLMERFRDVCTSLGIHVRTWQGPGNIASALFRKNGLPRKSAKPVQGEHITVHVDYPDAVQFANNAYYGGRFEAVYYGNITGTIWQYDINSAYAAVYERLPCVLHGEWVQCDSMPEPGEIYFGKVRFETHKTRHLGYFPFRVKNGRILFPCVGIGTYTGAEIDLARADDGIYLEWLDGWRYVKRCNCTPFSWVPELYTQRKALELQGSKDKGRILKLALASIYGKLAQSIGTPVYSNPIWASLITGMVRAQLLEAALMNRGGQDVVMLATDGIFCRAPRPDLPISEKLGEWDLVKHDGIFVVQSGVYFLPGRKPKTRGVPMTKVLHCEQEFRDKWAAWIVENARKRKLTPMPTILVPLRTFTGIKIAVHRGKPETAGLWSQECPGNGVHNDPCTCREMTFEHKSKRRNPDIWPGQELVHTEMRYTNTRIMVPCEESLSYSRDIGKMFDQDLIRDNLGMQPDWVSGLLDNPEQE